MLLSISELLLSLEIELYTLQTEHDSVSANYPKLTTLSSNPLGAVVAGTLKSEMIVLDMEWYEALKYVKSSPLQLKKGLEGLVMEKVNTVDEIKSTEYVAS